MGFLEKLLKKQKKKTAETPQQEEIDIQIKTYLERYPERPRLILIGSDKGGSGKSLIAGNLAYVISAHNLNLGNKIIVVDTDYRNSLPLSSKIFKRSIVGELNPKLNYTNFMDIITIGVGNEIRPVVAKPKAISCSGRVLSFRFLFIPATPHDMTQYYEQIYRTGTSARERLQYIIQEKEEAVSHVYTSSIAVSLAKLIEHLEATQPYTVIIDAPPMSSFEGRNEVYMRLLEHVDLFIYVTVPEPTPPVYDRFVQGFSRHLNKTIIVMNRVLPSHLEKYPVKLFIQMAGADGIPVFLIPHSEKDGEIYKNGTIPAKHLRSPTTRAVGAIARYLNLIDDCTVTGCCEMYDKALLAMLRFLQTLGFKGVRREEPVVSETGY